MSPSTTRQRHPETSVALSAEALSDLGARVATLMSSDLVKTLAVLATFDPDTTVQPEQRDAVEAISDRLADRAGRPEWMLKESVRVDVLARILNSGGRGELSRVRRSADLARDTALQRVLDSVVLEQVVDLEGLDEDELVAALHVGRWCAAAGSLASLPELAAGLDREWIEGRLALLETLRPLREITRDGVVGRDEELGRLRDYVAEGPQQVTILDRPPLLLYGVGGVGKSTLVAQFLLELAELPDPVAWAYLDLDRPSLASFEPLALLTDVIRQVGAQFPEVRRYLDDSGRRGVESQKGYGLEGVDSESWRGVVRQLARAVDDACRGRLIVVLDTYEELQRDEASGDSAGSSEMLFQMFARLSDDARGFRLVVSGRAPALTFVSSRQSDQRLHVEAFSGQAAIAVLQHLYERELGRLADASRSATSTALDPALAEKVVATVGGSPLTLRLAARVLALEGVAGLDEAAARSRALGRITDDFVNGFLYHRILGHIRGVRREDRDALQDVARASLVLRHVDADVLREVILPAITRPDLDADAMMAGLLAETALTDAETGTARLREELRGPAVLALGYSQPGLVTEVHRRAAAYYEAHPGLSDASVELAFHRLALGDPEAIAGLDHTAITALERSAAELPPTSRGLIERIVAAPGALSDELVRRADEREIEAAARRALDAGDLDAAARELAGQESWSPTTQLHRLVAQLEEARGDDEAALAATRRDLAAALTAADPQRYCAAAIRLALLLEQRLAVEEATAALAEADGQSWLAGHTLLRLELQLNRLGILERSAQGPWPVDRWLLELDVRALQHRADSGSVRATSVLVRLLAATLGRDEPALVLDAVRSVGLGTTTYSTFLRNLAFALAEWDAGRAEPGSIARSVGLYPLAPVTVDSLAEAWFQAVAGQGSADTVPLLDRAFSLEAPSPGITEALRQLYLWWDMDPQRGIREVTAEVPEGHFLDGPLDLGDSDAQRLLRALNGAYPAPTDRQVLAARVGLAAGSVNVKTTGGLSTRSLLDQAAESGMIPDLIGQVLADPKAIYFHDELRSAIGPEWLGRHGMRQPGDD